MTELFHENGHLTDQGLQALINGELDELQRLEASEHLAYCACCMDRYLEQLTGDVLLDPPQDLELPVARGIRAKLASQTGRRWATAAVAAVLSLTLWGTGVFQWIAPPRPEATMFSSTSSQEEPWWIREPKPQQEQDTPIAERFNRGLDQVFGAVSQACNSLADFMTPRTPNFAHNNQNMRGETTHEK